MNFGNQGFLDLGIKGFRNLKIFGSIILGFQDLGIQKFWVIVIVGYRNLGIWRSGDLRIEDLEILIFRFWISHLQGFCKIIFRYYGILGLGG